LRGYTLFSALIGYKIEHETPVVRASCSLHKYLITQRKCCISRPFLSSYQTKPKLNLSFVRFLLFPQALGLP
ncbi:MAG: hypothetical protein ACKPE1_16830, partial [Dolichospermum sp.]